VSIKRLILAARLLVRREQRERFAIRCLRLEPPGICDGQVQLVVAAAAAWQVHHERVLVLHADAEQPAYW
jgi:hypothetical protein